VCVVCVCVCVCVWCGVVCVCVCVCVWQLLITDSFLRRNILFSNSFLYISVPLSNSSLCTTVQVSNFLSTKWLSLHHFYIYITVLRLSSPVSLIILPLPVVAELLCCIIWVSFKAVLAGCLFSGMRRYIAGYVFLDVSKESVALASHLQSTGILPILNYLMYLIDYY